MSKISTQKSLNKDPPCIWMSVIPSKHPLVDTFVLFDETFTYGEKPQEELGSLYILLTISGEIIQYCLLFIFSRYAEIPRQVYPCLQELSIH